MFRISAVRFLRSVLVIGYKLGMIMYILAKIAKIVKYWILEGGGF